MKTKTLVGNALFAALYIVIFFFIQPIGQFGIQFRVPEVFNHLIVFNRKYFYGIVLGVFLSNYFFSTLGWYDLVFGVGQTVVSLLITMLIGLFVKNRMALLIVNTIVFTFNMFIIAIMLSLAIEAPFWLTWATAAAGEFGVLIIGIPIMLALNKRVNFNKLIK